MHYPNSKLKDLYCNLTVALLRVKIGPWSMTARCQTSWFPVVTTDRKHGRTLLVVKHKARVGTGKEEEAQSTRPQGVVERGKEGKSTWTRMVCPLCPTVLIGSLYAAMNICWMKKSNALLFFLPQSCKAWLFLASRALTLFSQQMFIVEDQVCVRHGSTESTPCPPFHTWLENRHIG